MPNLDFQPKMVGREDELRELQAYLDKAEEGEGSTVFISGEAGIGKTRLVNELKQVAQSKGFQILSGNCMYESLTPFMPIFEALRSGDLESLFAEEAPRVEAVYLVTNAGILIKEVVREETELNPDIFISMFTTVTDFLNESLSKLSGEEEKGTLNSLGYQNYRILIERRKDTNLVVILTGRENEFLLNDMREILSKITETFKRTLKEWGGDEKKVAGIEELLKPLITSGKYDGIYYGKDNPKIRRNLLFENVSLGLMRQAQQTPTLLCIEDLQWIDPSSLALMHYIARNTRNYGLFILGTYRPEDVTATEGKSHPLVGTMQLMDRENLYEKTELARLPKETINEFLSSLLGEIDFSDVFKIRIYKETEGNPLFVIQLIKYMVDEKIIMEDEGKWKLAKDLKDIEIPSKIYNVIERRLNRLEKEDRKVLDYASVIGEMFKSSVLTDALDTNKTKLLEQLRSLEQIHRLIHSHNGDFKFDHGKIKEVLYSEIPEELRRDYHSIIANSIETLNRDNLDEVIEDLEFHYYQCKNRDKALHYLMKAAKRAKKEYSNEEAIRFFIQILDIEEDNQKRIEIYEALGDIYTLIGIHDKSLDSFNSVLDLTDDKQKIAEIKIKIGKVYFIEGEWDVSLRIIKDALDLVKGEGSIEEALALKWIGNLHSCRAENDPALKYYNQSLSIFKTRNFLDGISANLNNIGIIFEKQGEFKKALEFYEKSLEISEKVENREDVVKHLSNIGLSYLKKGDYDFAIQYFNKSLQISEKIGLRGVSSYNELGYAYFSKGEYENALTCFKKGIKIYSEIGNQRDLSTTYCYMAELYLKNEDLNKAITFCNNGIDLSKKIGEKEVLAMSYRVMGMILHKQKKWNESIKNFMESVELCRTSHLIVELGKTYYEFGLMWKEKGDTENAKEHLNKALEIYEKLNLEYYVEKVRKEL
ncbi:MAG: DUF2791 family P-loop domain-containing protein [Thermoplasmata archaeon]|nr:MAG: DUF2791 family P-loop domain-containing protein [Thermoplasmata archaeon]